MLVKERLISRLFCLQNKLKNISSYNNENGGLLFRYAIELEVILSAMLELNEEKFYTLSIDFTLVAQRYCELGCEFCDENNRKTAFNAGKDELSLYIRECLRMLIRPALEALPNST